MNVFYIDGFYILPKFIPCDFPGCINNALNHFHFSQLCNSSSWE